MRSKINILVIAFIICAINQTLAQCGFLVNNNPAFEIDIPSGVQIDSAFLIISNYNATPGIRSRGKSFNNLDPTGWFQQDGKYSILNNALIGPLVADYQVQSGLDETCDRPLDFTNFDWGIEIYCSGLNGQTINYNGMLTDNLAIPTNIGAVYNGVNIVAGFIDLTLQGQGVELYPDFDFDGYGDSNAPATLFCSDYCHFNFVSNNLDCADYDNNINPDETEIPYNGIDDDCDPSTLDDDIDQDGFIAANDCNDNNPAVNPNAIELCNGIDDDCDNLIDDSDPDFSGYQTNTCLGISDSWNDVDNWSLGQIPTICNHVIVPNNITVRLFNGENGECHTIDVKLGAIFDVQNGAGFHAVAD